MGPIEKLAGINGFEFLEASTAHASKKFFALVINTDAVFTVFTQTKIDDSTTTITISGTGNNNLSGRTVSQGMYLPAIPGYYISAVTMSSGTAIGYKRT